MARRAVAGGRCGRDAPALSDRTDNCRRAAWNPASPISDGPNSSRRSPPENTGRRPDSYRKPRLRHPAIGLRQYEGVSQWIGAAADHHGGPPAAAALLLAPRWPFGRATGGNGFDSVPSGITPISATWNTTPGFVGPAAARRLWISAERPWHAAFPRPARPLPARGVVVRFRLGTPREKPPLPG